MEAKQNFIDLTCVQLSGALSLPVILAGSYIGQVGTIAQSLWVIYIGNAMLFLVAIFYLSIINQYKLTTIEFVSYVYGKRGAYICALGMIICMLGWTAIQLNLIYTHAATPLLMALISCVAIVVLGTKQLTNILYLNKIILPVMAGILLYELYRYMPEHIVTKPMSMREGITITLMVAVWVGFDMPTFYRHAVRSVDAYISSGILFFIALPMIEMVGVLSGDKILLPVAFLMLSAITGSTLNLYSASITLNRVTGISYQVSLIVFCVISAILGLLNIQAMYVSFLESINFVVIVVGMSVLGYFTLLKMKGELNHATKHL